MSFEGQPSIDHSAFHVPHSSPPDESSENNSDVVNTENIDELDLVEKPEKRRGKQDQFNQAVNDQLDKEFAENHDVGGLYFTHAFPSANLEGIIAQGGLRTPAQLRKRGNKFVTGSNASYAGQIFFSKGDIYTGYSTEKVERQKRADKKINGEESKEEAVEGGSAILVPQAEFHRVSRFWAGNEGSAFRARGHDEKEYMDTTSRGGEFAGISESDESGAPHVDMAKKLADALKTKRLAEIETAYEQKIVGLKADFDHHIADLPIEGFAKDADSVMFLKEEYKRFNEIPKQIIGLQATIAETDKKNNDLESKISDEESYLQTAKDRSAQKIAGLEPKGFAKFLEKFGIGKAEREQKIQTIRKHLDDIQINFDQIKSEQSENNGVRETAQSRISVLELYRKLCSELYTLVENTKRDLKIEKEKLEDKYRTETFSDSRIPLGTQTRALRERLRKSNETEDTEDKFRVGLTRSIILIDRVQMENALKSTEDKPDLRSRILVYDSSVVRNEYVKRGVEMFPKTDLSVIPDSLNAVQQLLCRTEDGMDILKTAQRGLPLKEPFRIAGIKRLDEYLEEQKQTKAV